MRRLLALSALLLLLAAPAFAVAVLNPTALWFVAGLAAGVMAFGLIGRLIAAKD